jgi:hypothetical protein
VGTSVGQFVAEIGADASDLAAEFEASIRDARTFALDLNRTLADVKPLTLDIGGGVDRAELTRTMSTIKQLGAEVRAFEGSFMKGATGELAEFKAGLLEGMTEELANMAKEAERIPAAFGGTEVASFAAQMSEADKALRTRVSLLSEGARMTATESQSLAGLRTIYSSVSRELATGNVVFERRIALERELVRIRQEFARVNTASRANVPALDFTSAARPAREVAAAMTTVAARAQPVVAGFRFINRETGEFTAQGRRAASTAIAVGFGLESLARGGSAAEGGLRTALRSVASFAPMFGVQGLIVSGVAASTAAIVDLFSTSRDEMRKTKEAFQNDISEMIRNRSIEPFLEKMERIELGDPSKPIGRFAGFQDGLKDLLGRLKEVETASVRTFATWNVPFAGRNRADVIASLKQEIEPLQKEFDELKSKMQFMMNLPPIRVGSIIGTVETSGKGIQTAAEAMAEFKKEVDNTLQLVDLLGGRLDKIPGLSEQIVGQYQRAAGLLASQADQTSEVAVGYRQILAQLKEVEAVWMHIALIEGPKIKPIDPIQFRDQIDKMVSREKILLSVSPFLTTLIPINLPTGKIEIPGEVKPLLVEQPALAHLRAQVKQAIQAKELLDLALFTPTGADDAAARQQFERATARVKEQVAVMAVAMRTAGITGGPFFVLLGQINKELEKMGLSNPVADVSDGLRDAVQAGRGLVQTARGFDLISDNAARSADSVLSVVDAVNTLKKAGGDIGKVLSGGLGLVGASLQLGEILFGESPLQREHNDILRANNEQLERLRLDLRGFGPAQQFQLGGQLLSPSILSILDRMAAGPRQVQIPSIVGLPRDFSPISDRLALERALTRTGYSLTQLSVIAEQSGFTIRDSQGRLVPQAIRDWATGMREAAIAAFHFADTITDQRNKIDLLNRVFDRDDAFQAITDNVELLRQFAPTLFEEFFRHVDFSNAAEVELALRALTLAFVEERLNMDALAGVLSRDELISIIDGVESGLDRLGNAADEVASSLLNLPAGFKVERLRFESEIAAVTTSLRDFLNQIAREPKSLGGSLLPGFPAVGGAAGGGRGAVVQQHFHEGAIKIDGKDKTPGELYQTFKKEAQRVARGSGIDAAVASTLEI